MTLNRFKFADLLELVIIQNIDGRYSIDDAIGVNINKVILPMRGDNFEKDVSHFVLVPPNHFAFNPRGSRKLGLGFNDTQKTFIITFNNSVFKVKDSASNIILNEYLFMYMSRKEFDRKAEYISWGSSTEVFDWNVFIEEDILIPSIESQQKIVDVYLAMIQNQKIYENSLNDLKLVCDIFVEDLRRNYKLTKLNEIIKETKEINSNSEIDYERGLNKLKGFVSPSKMSLDVDISKRKIVRHNDFVYPSPHFGEQGTIGLFKGDVCIMSQMYTTFRIIEKGVIPEYLMLWFTRSEFMRYAFFAAVDSIRDTFSFEKLSEYAIPVPSIEIQESISKIYQNLDLRKNIIDKLKVKINLMLPILIRGTSLSK